MTDTISNSDDIIDSRDVIARVDELTEYVADMGEDEDSDETDLTSAEDELHALKSLADEADGYADDWRHGEVLIRDSYFETYAQEFAEDIGAVDRESTWPNSCIDWEMAARELQHDFTSVEFDGVTYWIR